MQKDVCSSTAEDMRSACQSWTIASHGVIGPEAYCTGGLSPADSRCNLPSSPILHGRIRRAILRLFH